jgi:hypothetical protein
MRHLRSGSWGYVPVLLDYEDVAFHVYPPQLRPPTGGLFLMIHSPSPPIGATRAGPRTFGPTFINAKPMDTFRFGLVGA